MMFKLQFEGGKLGNFNSNKVISVVPATMQGFDANGATKDDNSTMQAAAKRNSKRERQRRREGKPESLIDIAARSQISPNQTPEAQGQEPAENDPVIESIPLPSALMKVVSPCVAEETPKIPKQHSAE